MVCEKFGLKKMFGKMCIKNAKCWKKLWFCCKYKKNRFKTLGTLDIFSLSKKNVEGTEWMPKVIPLTLSGSIKVFSTFFSPTFHSVSGARIQFY